MMKSILFALASTALVGNALAFDIGLLANNKEAESKVIKRKMERSVEGWLNANGSRDEMLKKSKSSLAAAIKIFEGREAYCDVGLSRLLKDKVRSEGLINHDEEFVVYVAYLRKNNLIDDLFYKNIMLSVDLDKAMENNSNDKQPFLRLSNNVDEKTKDLDLVTLYAGFKQWPNEISSCSLGRYFGLALNLTWKDKKERDQLLKKTNSLALERNIISLQTYNKLEVIRKQKAMDWPIFIKGYLDIVANAKDKLSPSGKPEVDPSKYSTQYVVRKERLTQRGRLYKNFDSTQVMILAEIIQKTAKRMDAHYVAINFQFEDAPDSEVETYVLSPMERYRLSIKMLRKDMGEVMRSELFNGTEIKYEDLVTAAYETGLIKSEELELILKFEDFWNPKDPKWKIYSNFAFSTLGTAAFYLPPPWNIIGAIALVVTQTQLNKKQKTIDADDNWNVVL